ncbi:cell division protein CrgA [Corynebacterium sp. 153RC1]|uniref:cell division protein CrgA n=1 Tax=Corynebacterium TaxID=1716 RepID=UPI00211B9C41|nr:MULTISPECIES: cell division protein CrgA [unclassified Corynebacterium]MCQ9370192.1 cell division protein CrgA [Corynebacterium sp. 35RC1]MCQ9344049.1 cell division protein CrgA [Corynebacterium sp. 76QC2CO]MCQ9352732.1 cell division protein CrgA [Corynebacterium sp. 209RC1]MCQ9354916.1 cell division protein CrgA [Corynebacterium sp. 1222RC1]MCQ9357177.1 cell division protein CrgA [Corynebacterium sp. 122RC1]
MPKSKITTNAVPQSSTTNRTPVKINASGTPVWYKVIMFALLLAGLAWLVVNYLAGPQIDFMVQLGAWNYAIGFGLFIVGLLMTMGWR